MTLRPNSPGRDLKTRYLYLGAAMLAGLVVLAGNLYRLQIATATSTWPRARRTSSSRCACAPTAG